MIKAILIKYKKASGQTVNIEKSLMISKNLSKEKEEEIRRALEIKASESLEQYLGMSFQLEKNKCKIFNKIKERVWKVIQS